MGAPDPFFFDWEGLLKTVPLSKSTIETKIRNGEFPRPRVLSGRRVGWHRDDVAEWSANRPFSDLPPPPNTGANKG